jgi:hypothetical protein
MIPAIKSTNKINPATKMYKEKFMMISDEAKPADSKLTSYFLSAEYPSEFMIFWESKKSNSAIFLKASMNTSTKAE